MAFAYCLDCGKRIYLGHRPWVGQAALCDWCDADLEVTHVNPLMLEWADFADKEETDLEADYLPA